MNFGLRDLSIHHDVQLSSARWHGGRPNGSISQLQYQREGGDNRLELTN